jgi:hypothetical protein
LGTLSAREALLARSSALLVIAVGLLAGLAVGLALLALLGLAELLLLAVAPVAAVPAAAAVMAGNARRSACSSGSRSARPVILCGLSGGRPGRILVLLAFCVFHAVLAGVRGLTPDRISCIYSN